MSQYQGRMVYEWAEQFDYFVPHQKPNSLFLYLFIHPTAEKFLIVNAANVCDDKKKVLSVCYSGSIWDHACNARIETQLRLADTPAQSLLVTCWIHRNKQNLTPKYHLWPRWSRWFGGWQLKLDFTTFFIL